jgi:DNA-binding transcriptional LysR family regulator
MEIITIDMPHQSILSLTLKQIRYTVAAADCGSVTAAAAQMNVSQPSVSMAIAAVEAHYGRKLFARQRGRGMTLTAFGRGFVTEARGVLDRAGGLVRLADRNAPVSGEVALGCFTDISPYYVPALLERFASATPAVSVNFRDAGFDALAAQLESGTIDLALTYNLGLSARIERITLLSLAPYAMLSADHPLARSRSVSLRQLARYPLILTDQALSWQHVLELFQRVGAQVSVYTRASSFELQRGMVANGLGTAIAYTRPVGDRSYDGRSLAIRPISDRLPDQHILLAWSRQSLLSPAARAFCDFAKANFPATAHPEPRKGPKS